MTLVTCELNLGAFLPSGPCTWTGCGALGRVAFRAKFPNAINCPVSVDHRISVSVLRLGEFPSYINLLPDYLLANHANDKRENVYCSR
jgi:hypothetical protein